MITRALITGASSGIGEAFARELAASKVNLILVARRKERLDEIAADLRTRHGIEVVTLAFDLSLASSPQELFKAVTANGQKIDLLINNAGVGVYRHFLNQELSQHLSTLQLNLITLTELTYLFAAYMLKQGGRAYIANVASIAAYQGVPRFSVYAASKSYVRVLSTILARELKGTGLSVSCICPGGTATEFLEKNGQSLKQGKGSVLMTPERVAKIGLRGIFDSKPVIIPGFINKIACFFPRFLPDGFAMKVAELAMSSAVEEKPR